MRVCFWLLIGMVIGLGGHAQALTVIPRSGEPVVVKVDELREMAIAVSLKAPGQIPFDMRVTSHDCVSAPPDSATFMQSVQTQRVSWVWVKHPQPEKIGTVVSRVRGQNLVMPLFAQRTATQLNMLTGVFSQLPVDQMIWGSVTSPAYLNLLTWTNRITTFNSQTGVIETRMVNVANDLLFKPTATGQFEVDYRMLTPTPANLVFFDFYFPAFQQEVEWLFRESNGVMCQTVWQVDMRKAAQAYFAYSANSSPPAETYRWDSDELTAMLTQTGFLEYANVDGTNDRLE